jgi:peroxiredoxin
VNSTGNGVGQVASDFELTDQHGETVRLHDFCGKAVLLVASAMWCGPCQSEASELASIYDQYADDGFIVITLLGENSAGQSPSRGDLQTWADAFGIDHPVVADPGFGVGARFVTGGSLYLPSTSLLGDGAVVIKRDSYISTNDITGALP